ncbi:uncharacterized protein LOC124916266 [Impatiens glandulifera]|uniref:uncharacterized protein LOC124916266 n=1 Tax=Impatiens glandulifera TaxID=253017 RepID=UPI001FB12926|nr:uncharacterized protein LOC124916266 [Impatiens glandulifera]
MEEPPSSNRGSILTKYLPKSNPRYHRLNGSNRRRNNLQLAVLGGGGPRKRRINRFWRIKILKKPKLKLRFFSPKKLLIKLRDAYVNFMLRLSNSSALGGSAFGGGMVDVGVAGFGRRPMKEYDEKMIVEMYKSILIRQSQLMPYGSTKISSQI